MVDLIKIDKGVPMPARPRGWNKARYPWDQMGVGDSFYSPRPLRSMRVQVHLRNAKYKNATYKCAAEGRGTRVWRIK